MKVRLGTVTMRGRLRDGVEFDSCMGRLHGTGIDYRA